MLAAMSNTNQELVIYISMAFGNPYGDVWNDDILLKWIYKLQLLGVKRFSIADTTGEALPKNVNFLYKFIAHEFPKLDLSVHLHSSKDSALEKINAAYDAGCTRFEGAILGYGGCPFAQDDLVGNISTELLLSKFVIAKDIDINKLKISFFDMIS